MCTINDKIKLCTCNKDDVRELKNYWILKRPTEEPLLVVGEMILPANISNFVDSENKKTLLKKLNSGNCFDKEFQIQVNDILELHFTIEVKELKYLKLNFNGNFLVYVFKFKSGKWKFDHYNPYNRGFEEVIKGKINNPFLNSAS